MTVVEVKILRFKKSEISARLQYLLYVYYYFIIFNYNILKIYYI